MKNNRDREITKIVCFCVFDGSYILEHLQNENSYLLKLCRDPDSLEHVVDTMHPDVILIDCSGNLSSGAEPEKLIDLNDVVLSQDTFCCDEASDFKESSPPILVPNYLPQHLEHLPIWNIATKSETEIIFIFDSDPGDAVKSQCFENRCDLMVAPFSFEELKFRIKLHVNQKELNQRVNWQRSNLDRAVEHIEKLKQIIFDTRNSWSRENELLHNSLNQINMMTNDRDILRKELKSARIKFSENIRGINQFLCSMVESQNEYQKGHSKRVAEIAEFVASEMRLESKSVRLLKNAAMLHEVGMLLIPSSILSKDKSQLSDYEKNMMLHHPSEGASYLKRCPGFEKIAEVIRHLHENSDGTGYPEGLKKRYIPLLSKILAGADVLDQISIDNPHASVDRLLQILEEEFVGSRLDPSIVNFLEKYLVTINSQNVRLKEIAVYQLKSGMVIGTGLFTKTGTKLFSSGTTLTEESIRKLEKYTKEYPVDETIFIKI
ncbi:MAG: HD domain-containing protein [Desulfamplus sp.]|nr:HD domain-containing protein [Desulfamplus sp.]